MERPLKPITAIIISVVLAAVTLAVFWAVRGHDYLIYDDGDYVSENSHVLTGLSLENARWAFTTNHASNWHPLTWLSLMLDCQLFGTGSAALHLSNVGYHLLNTVLLFLLLRRMTQQEWPSAMVAALFAWHPLHVQSVAWIAERKDVLSTLFWILTTWAYVRQIEKPTPGRRAVTLTLFALGLMAKQMLVTLPCTLVLLDIWPLRRWRPAVPGPAGKSPAIAGPTLPRLILEKWPFFVLALAASLATFAVQKEQAVVSLELIPISDRLRNVVVSYVRYLEMMLWPSGLSVIYAYAFRRALPLWQVAASLGLLAGITVAAWRWLRARPYWLVGWLWYLGTLVPVIGIVQVGSQAMADRYTYVPLIGIFVALVWGAADLAQNIHLPKWTLALGAGVVLGACLLRTHLELPFWRDSVAIFTRAVAVTQDNDIAHHNLGYALAKRHEFAAAITHYHTSIRLNPRFADVYNNLAAALAETGNYLEAVEQYQMALSLRRKYPEAQNNLGMALGKLNRHDDSVAAFQEALRLRPNYPTARKNLANVFIEMGRLEEGAAMITEYLRDFPRDATAYNNRGMARARQNKPEAAVVDLREAVRLQPDYADALGNMGIVLSTQQKFTEAIPCYERALKLKPADPQALGNLGIALASLGRYDEAVTHYAESLRLDPGQADVRTAWGRACAVRRNYPEAIRHFSEVLRLKPQDEQARLLLGAACASGGKTSEAIQHYRAALKLKPDWPLALNSFARLLATHPEAQFRSGAEAVRLAERAHVLTHHRSAPVLDTLAACFAEVGRFSDAVMAEEMAIKMQQTLGQTNDVPTMLERQALYRTGKPWRESP